MVRARIQAIASYLPEKVLTNKDLERMVDTSDEWITSRTGMKERRIASAEQASSDLGTLAAQKLLQQANLDPTEIDLILVATSTPDYVMPGTAPIIQANLKATQAAAFDIQAACAGFLYGLSIAKAYIESGMAKKILLIATDKMSSFVDYQDRATCVLWGDGASAALLTGEGSGYLVQNVLLGADGSLADLIMIPSGGTRNPVSQEALLKRDQYFKMSGSEVFKHAVRKMGSIVGESLKKSQLQSSDISWVIPHQANERILDAIAKQLSLPLDRICKTLHKYGNTSASSCGITLDELIQKQRIQTGEHLLMVAFGAGLTWGASVLTKVEE